MDDWAPTWNEEKSTLRVQIIKFKTRETNR